jgi:cytochrome P450
MIRTTFGRSTGGSLAQVTIAPPPSVPITVTGRIASDLRAQWRARGEYPPGETSYSFARTREFERDPLSVLLRCWRRYGPVFTVRLLYAPIVFMLGPQANHYVTVSHARNFRWRDGSMGDMIPLLGDGLLTTDGDRHARARRIMLPAFHRDRIAVAAATMLDEAERAVERWSPGDELDLYAWTRRLALRVAQRALFGFDPDRDPRMAEEFEQALGLWGRDYLMRMLRTPASPWRRMLRARARLDVVIFGEIERRRAGERGDDVLSLLLDARDEDGSSFSDEELRDQVMTLLFAGHDTATSTVAFLFYELGRAPHELDRLYEELDDSPPPSAQLLASGLPRLDMAVDETLRLYPPAWVGPRRAVEPFEFAGVRVPAGAFVNYCSWASHHLPEVFPDPEAFVPERFSAENRAKLPKGAYVPFGGGSRTCIGMRFGLMEIKAIAATILRRFRLELVPRGAVSIRQMPTLSPRGGLPVYVRERE